MVFNTHAPSFGANERLTHRNMKLKLTSSPSPNIQFHYIDNWAENYHLIQIAITFHGFFLSPIRKIIYLLQLNTIFYLFMRMQHANFL